MSARDLALVAVFAALVAALGLFPAISVGSAVPITLQSMGPMICGAVLGRRLGAASLLLFLALVALGLPLLAGGHGGLAVFAGPTVGYLVGWPVAAYVIGWLTERGPRPYRLSWGVVAHVIGGIVVLYVFGIAGLVWQAGVTVPHAVVINLPFVPGDLAKAVVAALVARGVFAGLPDRQPSISRVR
ncbi:biotin transporter BioY [Nocardioides mangrovicus]|uniref:Biotin transporter n=1 Tax=Nocardioides mangrovicus TaxID=2478913 RepID=A0A3L8P3A5_9ACTN|nr:biotin transporter BioY [Nocardioides mangrovicus]